MKRVVSMEKQEKIKIFIREMMQFAPSFRKNFTTPPLSMKTKLSPHQLFCLINIYKHGPISMGDLALKLGVSNQQLTRIVDGLVEQKMTKRIQDKTNRRVVQAEISEIGKKTLQDMHLAIQESTAKALEVLGEEELDELNVHMKALSHILAKVKFDEQR